MSFNRDAVLSFSRNQYVLFLLGGTESLYEFLVAHVMVLSHILIELIARHDAGHRAACSTAIAPVEIRRLEYASPSPTASAPYIAAPRQYLSSNSCRQGPRYGGFSDVPRLRKGERRRRKMAAIPARATLSCRIRQCVL